MIGTTPCGTDLKDDGVRRLVLLDRDELLAWDLRVGEPSSNEIGLLEFSQSLRVKSGFQLLQDISELCKGKTKSDKLAIIHEGKTH